MARRPSSHAKSPDYEYAPLRMPPGADRMSTQTQLSVQAEFAGWELANLRLYADGTKQILMRRRRRADNPLAPGLST